MLSKTCRDYEEPGPKGFAAGMICPWDGLDYSFESGFTVGVGATCNFSLPIIRLTPAAASCAAIMSSLLSNHRSSTCWFTLVQNRDRLVSKDDLIASVWGGQTVSDLTLSSRINAVRRAIGDNGEDQRLFRTVARKGFRFVAGLCACSRMTLIWPTAPGRRRMKATSARRRSCRSPTDPPSRSSSLTNMSGDPEQEYFSDGITEDIITALSKLRWFFVIARNSSFIYKAKAVHLKQIAEELGVRYVVEGSVRRSGDRVRITVQLNDVNTGSHIWAERYDRDLADVFAVQDEIGRATGAKAIEHSSTPPKIFVPGASRPTIWTPGIW